MAAGVGPLIATVPTITYPYPTISKVEKRRENETYTSDECMNPEEPLAYEQR